MEKTVYETKRMVETISILPRTLEVAREAMKVGDVNAYMFVVYGKDPADRKVWCATFIDEQEAEAWTHGSRTFGRPVLGAVMAGQGEMVKGGEMSDDAVEAPSNNESNETN